MRQERYSFSDCRLQVGSTEVPRRGYAEHLPTLASGSKAHCDGLRSLPHAGDADLPADHNGAVSKRARGLISPAARLNESEGADRIPEWISSEHGDYCSKKSNLSIAGLIREFKDRFASDVTRSSAMNVAADDPFRALQSLSQPRHRLRYFEVESPSTRNLPRRPLDDLDQHLLALFDAEMAVVPIELIASGVEITDRSCPLKVDFDALAHFLEGDEDVIDFLAGWIIDCRNLLGVDE